MPYATKILDDLRVAIAPEDLTLKTARERRDDALDAATAFDGVANRYNSGSIAHGTANDDTDADGGVVLDRRTWRELGPDADDVGPCDVVEQVRSLVRETLQDSYSSIKTRLTKRAITLKFQEELANGTDPSVDMIVGLQRADGGLWIPNLDTNSWDASDPIRHTKLLTADPKSLRVIRARIVRLAKCWNAQYSRPGMCSFNIEALALACITEGMSVGEGLADFFAYSAADIAKHNTSDPAEVSKPIKLKVDRDVMVDRLDQAAGLMRTALDNDNDEPVVRTALADLFWKYLEPPPGSTSKSSVAASLRGGNAGVSMGSGLALGTAVGTRLKSGRAFGGEKG